ncbi:ABC transporter substrate-binding protein [Cellulomonas bogoriensis]|uniref:ABC transporter substrate-binding protein n=1 Tax=Cellulomonas bogoriensis 69B4 = DSM 16987 TaxID=1386082 RepID=A0A0A0C2P4_9CELL|nr:ABC transporter substrate-binding protein [Cellulomonas bogoriensis]KGM14461.1 ABC transporter substrate-binding protein [Cellulomonas bogoriensis 69B4 = DSM 16987]
MKRSTHMARAAALAGAVALVLTACAGDADEPAAENTPTDEQAGGDTGPLIVGSLLPQTGSLAFLGPPEIAGVDLAVEEINDAGGVLGSPVEIHHTDSSDAANSEVATQSVTDLQSRGAQVIIGAAASSVTRIVIDDITGSEIVQISPANTATDLSGYSPFYFRTAPSDVVQGDALANLILEDGHADVAFIVFNDDYGITLRDVAQATLEDAGATVTYGSSGDEFDPQSNDVIASTVTAALATDPDAVVVIAFDQTRLIVPALVSAGFDASNLYFVDGNLSDYSEDFEPGTLEGAQGTLPGAFPSDEFQGRLLEVDPDLRDYSYAAESYDAVILAALAAVRGGGTDGPTIQANLAAVSGAEGGTECIGFSECAALLDDGQDIDYQAVSGVGPFADNNDPSSAYVGIYRYEDDNSYTWVKAVFGEVG